MPKLKMERTEYTLISDGVMDHEQTLSTGKPFWVFMSANIGISTWLVGVIIASMGLNFTDAMFAILFGSLIGSALPATMALLGPVTRLSQMEAARFSLGLTGKRIPAFLNWIGTIGWDSINNILSTAALVALFHSFGVYMPFWLALAVLVIAQLVIGVYGHHLIQETAKYTGTLLALFFIVIGVVALHKSSIPVTAEKASSLKDIISVITLIVAFNAGGWTPYTADYTRYLPAKTPKRNVFLPIFSALFISVFVLAVFGYMTASVVSEQTPDSVMSALQGITGHFAPVVLLLIAFNSIPVNAVNDNSAAYSLMSAGFKFTRPVAAIFGAVLGYVVCISASNSFIEFFENFLLLFTHWVAAWAAVVLVHWFIVGKKQRTAPPGFTLGCLIFLCVSITTIVLFASNSLYTGCLSEAIGGLDIGPYIGFITAGTIYYLALKYKAVKV